MKFSSELEQRSQMGGVEGRIKYQVEVLKFIPVHSVASEDWQRQRRCILHLPTALKVALSSWDKFTEAVRRVCVASWALVLLTTR